MSATKIAYQSIVNNATYFDPTSISTEDLDFDMVLVGEINSTMSKDCLNIVLPSEGYILEAMVGVEISWDDLHHRSYFFPDL